MSDDDEPVDRETIEAIAREVAKLLDRRPGEEGLLTPDDVAARLNVDRRWVYAHADELGGIRIGSGSRPLLRFDAAVLAQQLLHRPATKPAQRPWQRSAGRTHGGPLLPIRPSRPRAA